MNAKSFTNEGLDWSEAEDSTSTYQHMQNLFVK